MKIEILLLLGCVKLHELKILDNQNFGQVYFGEALFEERMKGESESPIYIYIYIYIYTSSDENYFKSIFGSVSYCAVILRTTPHW